ncbi:hypothetical protein EST38_g498 [Candolleomyces aberdarensis]|uniref:Phytocyanin domain-containing protein n=1 Tax=Candolleomyces aberdarensis TaxID=2316362 RepID=A0A4Q2E1S6_9AGAR|nr:hypothetical protein EST38_g498 [Candolleomyces aberdarensis]
MRFSTGAAFVFLASALTTVLAETFVVTVGKNASLLFEPTSVTAKVGDVIAFQFMSKNHTVTQSTFDNPCAVKADGVDSGYQFIPQGTNVFPQWSITVNNDTAPLWFFCNQKPHCERGMVFAVNPTAEKTFEKFNANALASAPPATTAAPAATTSAAPTGTSAPDTGAANAAAGALSSPAGSGAMSRASISGWPVVLASVIIGALAL